MPVATVRLSACIFLAVVLSLTLEREALAQQRPIQDSKGSASAPAPVQPENGPSLSETLAWLREKLPLAFSKYSYTMNGNTWVSTNRVIVGSLESCSVTLDYIIHSDYRSTSSMDEMTSTFRYTVPLGLISEGSISSEDLTIGRGAAGFIFTGGDRRRFELKMKSTSKAIATELEPMRSGKVAPGTTPKQFSMQNYFSIDFNDEGLAQRVLTAFLHASELCRKKEVF